LASTVQAERTRSVGLVPDPSCRSSKLVVPVEQALSENLRGPGLKIEKKDPASARLLLQYFLSVHRDGENIFVHLDGQIYGNSNGKLYAEGSVRSEPHPDDDNGRTQAARQAARRIGQQLSDDLATTLKRPGRGRRVMLQVSLDEDALSARQTVLKGLMRDLSGMSPRQRGSTDRNLMLTLFTTERPKDLAEQIERAVSAEGAVRAKWLVQSRKTMMLQISGAGR
jgi:hypothetical protein